MKLNLLAGSLGLLLGATLGISGLPFAYLFLSAMAVMLGLLAAELLSRIRQRPPSLTELLRARTGSPAPGHGLARAPRGRPAFQVRGQGRPSSVSLFLTSLPGQTR